MNDPVFFFAKRRSSLVALGWTRGLLAACSFGCFIGLALKGGFEEQNLFPLRSTA